MHYLANLAALNDQSCLYALSYANQIVVNGRNSQQRWDGGVRLVQVSVAQNNVVYTLVYTGFSLMAQVVERLYGVFPF